MEAIVEPLDGNKVKLSIQVDENEFEKDIDAAFRRIAREVSLPGFRPGKAPRRLLEAKLGTEVGREEALREAVPAYYSRAVREHDVDAIAPPEIELTEGKENGPVAFDAVVEIRPVITVGGYANLRVQIDRPDATEEEVDAQVEKLRQQFAELGVVERPAQDGDHVTISLTGSRDGEVLAGLQADDYLYEVGSAGVADELDTNLRGAKVGDVLEFDAQPPDPDEAPVQFRVLVKEVKEKLLPAVNDEWTNDVSEFDTVDELRTDLGERISSVRKIQAHLALREKAAEALVELVEDAPEPMVESEIAQRLREFSIRLGAQGVTAEEYLERSGRTQEDFIEELRASAVQAVKADLALRALCEAEGIECTDDELDRELEAVAERLGEKAAKLRKQLERADQITAVRSDVKKRKALDWLVEHLELVDQDGAPIDRSTLMLPEADHDDEATDGDDPVDADQAQPEATDRTESAVTA